VDEVVTNAIQWLSDNMRDLPWLEVSCSAISLPPEPFGASAVSDACPLVDPDDPDGWSLSLTLDGLPFGSDTPSGAMLHGKVTIEHNASEQGRVNIPVTADLLQPGQVYLPLVIND
jgi:hypothetical protein